MEYEIEVARRNGKGVLVEQRIMDGRTEFFILKREDDAYEYARNKRSYVENCYRENELVGFTVPN